MMCIRQFGGIGIVLAVTLVPRMPAANNVLPGLPTPTVTTIQGRALLRAGRLADAERVVQALLETSTDDAWCLAGELSFRRGDFDLARQAFEAATSANPSDARAWWGLGRIELLYSHRERARDLFSRAWHLDPRDPEILLSCLDFISDPAARATILRNVVVLARASQPARAEWALARLEIEERLAGREPGALDSPYKAYRIPLSGFRPLGERQHGLMLLARVNGGRPLRLVVDSGARGILVYRSAARGLELEPMVASQVGGLGTGDTAESVLSLARTLAIGDLRLRDCLVEVSSREIVAGTDGVISPNVFERFLVRIDPRARVLELAPRGDSPSGPAAQDQPAVNLGGLILVRAQSGRGGEGWFLVDTGAAFTAVDRESAPLSLRSIPVDLNGVQGDAGAYRLSLLSLHVAGRSLADPEAIAIDLGRISQHEGVAISGILGYSLLSRWPLTFDFHNGTVRIGDTR